jgi:hypothetical protein
MPRPYAQKGSTTPRIHHDKLLRQFVVSGSYSGFSFSTSRSPTSLGSLLNRDITPLTPFRAHEAQRRHVGRYPTSSHPCRRATTGAHQETVRPSVMPSWATVESLVYTPDLVLSIEVQVYAEGGQKERGRVEERTRGTCVVRPG